MYHRILFALLACAALAPAAARAQSRTDEHRFEAGAVLTGLDISRATGEKPIGVGVRFAYELRLRLQVLGGERCQRLF
ncbi:MAG TPA: hypothetical protein VF736_07640 [Pyrinomonadaceae bacterium]|jgi:hypothetical protein